MFVSSVLKKTSHCEGCSSKLEEQQQAQLIPGGDVPELKTSKSARIYHVHPLEAAEAFWWVSLLYLLQSDRQQHRLRKHTPSITFMTQKDPPGLKLWEVGFIYNRVVFEAWLFNTHHIWTFCYLLRCQCLTPCTDAGFIMMNKQLPTRLNVTKLTLIVVLLNVHAPCQVWTWLAFDIDESLC